MENENVKVMEDIMRFFDFVKDNSVEITESYSARDGKYDYLLKDKLHSLKVKIGSMTYEPEQLEDGLALAEMVMESPIVVGRLFWMLNFLKEMLEEGESPNYEQCLSMIFAVDRCLSGKGFAGLDPTKFGNTMNFLFCLQNEENNAIKDIQNGMKAILDPVNVLIRQEKADVNSVGVVVLEQREVVEKACASLIEIPEVAALINNDGMLEQLTTLLNDDWTLGQIYGQLSTVLSRQYVGDGQKYGMFVQTLFALNHVLKHKHNG